MMLSSQVITHNKRFSNELVETNCEPVFVPWAANSETMFIE